MCKIWASKAQLLSPQIAVFGLFHIQVSTGLTSVMFYMLIVTTFRGCWIWASNAHFGGILGPQISQNSGLWSFSQNVFTGFTSVLPHMQVLLEVWRRRASESQFLGHFGPQNSRLLSFSQKVSTGFASVLAYMSIWGTFIGVLNIGLRGPISGSFWAQKYTIIQAFGHFLKHFRLVLHHSSLTCSLGVRLGAFQWCAPEALFLGLELRLQRSFLGRQAFCFHDFYALIFIFVSLFLKNKSLLLLGREDKPRRTSTGTCSLKKIS